MSIQEPLFAEERKNKIIELVISKKKVLVPDLIEYFHVSPATIRNDLRELEHLGLIKRTHGGAIPTGLIRVGYEADNVFKAVEHLDKKMAIAQKALSFIEEGDIIILDTGSTTMELAKLLSSKKNLTVVINDLEIAKWLEGFEDLHVIFIGGTIRRHFHCTIGPFATKLLSELNVDKVFLGTNSFSIQKGCTTPDISQAEVKKIMVDIATQVIVLCDSSKIGVNSFVQFAPPFEIDALITDELIDKGVYRELSSKGVDVHIASLTNE